MARSEFFCQCKLHKPLDDGSGGHRVMVSWIPASKATVGNVVRLKNTAKEEWKEGWEVIEVWSKRRFADIEKKERDHLRQRKASDR